MDMILPGRFKSLLPLLLLLTACGRPDKGGVALFAVERADFESAVQSVGFVEPINFLSIGTPPVPMGLTIAYLVDDGTYVEQGDTICMLDNAELKSGIEQAMLEVERIYANFDKNLINQQVQLALTESQVESNKAEMETMKFDSLGLEFLSPSQRRIKELEMRQAVINSQRLERKLKSQKLIQQAQTDEINGNIRRIQEQIGMFTMFVNSLCVRAPRAGIVSLTRDRRGDIRYEEGDDVWEGVTIATMPDVEVMKVRMNIPETDYKLISIGDSVAYTFDAIPGAVAYGRVTAKAPVGQPLTNNSNVKFYDVDASLDSVTLMPDPGFTANSKIMLRHVADTIVVPLVAVYDQDSVKVAYVQTRRGFRAQQVLLGPGSHKDVVITHGLEVGDVVSLTRPPDDRIKSVSRLSDEVLREAAVLRARADSLEAVNDSLRRAAAVRERANAVAPESSPTAVIPGRMPGGMRVIRMR